MRKLLLFVLAALFLTACKSAPKGEAKAPAPKAGPKVGIQLYSLRSDCEKDLEGVLKALSQDGYDGVELAGFYQYSPEQFKSLCDKYGLKIISAHVGRKELIADPIGQAKLYASLGCKYVALPWAERGMDLPGAPGYNFYLDDLKKIAEALKAEGITFLYHSHDFEFVDYKGKQLIDVLLDDCGKDVLQSELDTCWCHVAGTDPSEFMLSHKGLCPLVHFKDYVGTPEGTMYALIGKEETQGEKKAETFEYRPVGDGKLDLKGMLKAAKKAGTKWVIVEQDEPTPGMTSLECAKKSVKNVRKALNSL